MNPIQLDRYPCFACGRIIEFKTLTNNHPQCPQFTQLPQGAWFFPVRDLNQGPGGRAGHHTTTIQFACSEACARVVVDGGAQ